MSDKNFQLGQLLATPAALRLFTHQEITECLIKHARGKWGNLTLNDWNMNNSALKNGGRIMSVYKLSKGRVLWIITEAEDDEGNRSATTMLLPSDY